MTEQLQEKEIVNKGIDTAQKEQQALQSGGRKKRLLRTVLSVALAVAIVGGATYLTARQIYGTPKPAPPTQNQNEQSGLVQITDQGFVPGALKISTNQSITWKNDTSQNQELTHSQEPAIFPPTTLEQKEELTYTFATAGSYTFKLTSGATLQVIVE